MWVNQIFGGIHWHRPVLRHPLCQLHDIKYYSSCDVNKFPVKSFPLIISVKQIYYSLRNFRKLLPLRIHNSQILAKIMQFISSRFFRKYLANYSSYFSIHPPLDFAPFIFFHLFTILVWKYIYSLYLFHRDPIIILKFLPVPSIPRNNPARNPS